MPMIAPAGKALFVKVYMLRLDYRADTHSHVDPVLTLEFWAYLK